MKTAKANMQNKRKTAWIITILLIILSIFAGAFTSYTSLRRESMAAFQDEILPTVRQALVPAHDLHTLASRHLDGNTINSIGIPQIVNSIQNTENPIETYTQFVYLNRAVWEIYDMLEHMAIEAGDRNLITALHANFMGLDLILSLSPYNALAHNFNDTLGNNLGFLIRVFIDEMPIFD